VPHQLQQGEAVSTIGDAEVAFEIPGKVRVSLQWIGEGYEGDYDSDNPDDAQLLRLDAADLTKHAPAEYCSGSGCCRSAQDASYCTLMTAELDREVAASMCEHIAKQLEGLPHWKRPLERLSWVDDEDASVHHQNSRKST
jgi:hypothetical protein